MTSAKPGSAHVREELAAAVIAILRERGLTPVAAAGILGMTESKAAALMRGDGQGLSEGRLLDCLVRLGQDVHIVVNEKPPERESGRVSVLVMRPFKRRPPRVGERITDAGTGGWDPMTGAEKKDYAAVLRAQSKDDAAPPISKEEAEMILLQLAPTGRAH